MFAWASRWLAATASSLFLVAQEPPPTAQDPQRPGLRVDRPLPTVSGELYFDEAVQALNGKLVKAVQVTEADRRAGVVTVVPAERAAPILGSLATRAGQPFEARRISADCSSLWSLRRLVVRAYAEEVDGEVLVTFQVDLQVERYEDVEFVGNDHLDQAELYALVGFYAGRRTTRTEAEAMRKLLLARYRRDGYAFCSIQLVDLPVVLL